MLTQPQNIVSWESDNEYKLGPQLPQQKPSNPILQRGKGYLSQVFKINLIEFYKQNNNIHEIDESILNSYSQNNKHVHDGVLKIFDRYFYNQVGAETHVADMMYFNEVATFNKLHALQGKCIPRLIDYGCYFNSNNNGLEETLRTIESHVLDGPFTITENVSSKRKLQADSLCHYNQALHSLQLLHEYNVVHGDVRMQNMILQPDGRVIFIDFGHSQYFDESERDDFEVMKFQDLMKLKKIFSIK